MGDEAISGGSYMVVSKHITDNSSPVLLGASCALFALRLLLEPNIDDEKLLESRRRILEGGAQLLGLLVWSVRKEESNRVKRELLDRLESAEREIGELKRRRSEDAKANEKVVNIFATHEQSWFNARKMLQQQVGVLLNELKTLGKNKDDVIAKLNEQLQEKELLLQSKEESLKEQLQKNMDLEGKLDEAKAVAEELRETARHVVEEHSTEIWKHKTAFIELVSTQRQLEAEMGRAVRQVEAAKQDLDTVLEQKEESFMMTQKLSTELIRMRKELEQKDNILSAMFRKSKLDTEEKQMLLKEVKLSKSKRKQAELETERWRTVSESRHERLSLRNMLSKHAKSKLDASLSGMGMPSSTKTPAHIGKTRAVQTELIEYDQPGLQNEHAYSCSSSEKCKTSGTEELDFKQLEGWVRFEAEKYAAAFEQRHHIEIDAFAEQMRLKDEKVESCHWRSLSMEIELKRLQTHIEGLNLELSHLRQENLQLEDLLLDREAKLQSLTEASILQLKHPNLKRSNSISSSHDFAITGDTIWSKVKIVKSRPGDKEHETTSQDVETELEAAAQVKDISKDILLMAPPSPEEEFQEEKVVILDPSSIQEARSGAEMVIYDDKSTSAGQLLSTKTDNNSWKMDLTALGVSFKIKRIKQQLLMFERLTGKLENREDRGDIDHGHLRTKGVPLLLSFLNKQVSRYMSLQEKTDNLCKRMHENDIYATSGGTTGVARKKEETKMLEHFLEDTFQLQRYIVATGQKSSEIQSKIACGFVGPIEHGDMQRFGQSLITLFKDVQRGLEVRISRIIGDLEGTLACEACRLRKFELQAFIYTMEAMASSSASVRLPPESANYDEVSMHQSLLFADSLKDLRNLRKQLYTAADYFEKSFTNDESKRIAVDALKDYTIKALVSTIDHLGSVTYKVNDLLSEKIDEVSGTVIRVSYIEQRLRTCQTYINMEGASQQSLMINTPKYHKHYILPVGVTMQDGNKNKSKYEGCNLDDQDDWRELKNVIRATVGETPTSSVRKDRSPSPSTQPSLQPQNLMFSANMPINGNMSKRHSEKRTVSPHRFPLLRFGSFSSRPASPNSRSSTPNSRSTTPNLSRPTTPSFRQGSLSEPRKSVSMRHNVDGESPKANDHIPGKSKRLLKALLSKRKLKKDDTLYTYLDEY